MAGMGTILVIVVERDGVGVGGDFLPAVLDDLDGGTVDGLVAVFIVLMRFGSGCRLPVLLLLLVAVVVALALVVLTEGIDRDVFLVRFLEETIGGGGGDMVVVVAVSDRRRCCDRALGRAMVGVAVVVRRWSGASLFSMAKSRL